MSFDPEAEQQVDFGRYGRLLAQRWWLPVAGLVLGAIIGYLLTVGGAQRFKATATLYLGQPYTASGNVQLQGAQTNPSTVRQLAHSQLVIQQVAKTCKTKDSAFRGGISTQNVAGNIAKNGQTPLVTVSVQSAKRHVATCAANEIAKVVVAKVSPFANQKINNFSAQITNDQRQINTINKALDGSLSLTDKLLLLQKLTQAEEDRLSTGQLLLQAKVMERPSVLVGAAAQKITARSKRNSLVVAALIGLILGALAALAWDGVAERIRS
jgi:capsular polysaccharide biosynthesis protein